MVLSHQNRSNLTDSAFFKSLNEAGFSVCKVDQDKFDPEFYIAIIGVYLIKLA
jgi:hypothetical protein